MVKRDGLAGTRKAQKALRLGRTVSGAGPSLLSTLEGYLLTKCQQYLDLEEYTEVRYVCRGEIRGLARAIAKVRLPYEEQRTVVKQIEKEYIRKAKRWNRNPCVTSL